MSKLTGTFCKFLLLSYQTLVASAISWYMNLLCSISMH